MIKQIREICNRCQKQFSDIIINENNYRYCKDCSLKLLKLGVLIEAPKSVLGKSPKISFDYIHDEIDFHEKVNLIKLSKDLQIDLKKSLNQEHEKMKNNLSVYCCLCIKNKKKSISQPNDSSVIKFYDIKLDILIENPDYKFYSNHLVCHPCLEKFVIKKLGLDEKNKNIEDITKSVRLTCFCNICSMEHDTIFIPNSVKGKNKGGCCANGCILF